MNRLIAFIFQPCCPSWFWRMKSRSAWPAISWLPCRKWLRRSKAKTGNTVNLASGSSGRLYAQIANGAPYHAFFSAPDQGKACTLIEAELADTNSLFTYATGSLVLWMQKTDGDPYEALLDNRISRLAVANPQLAPLWCGRNSGHGHALRGETSLAELVLGENINQAYQFVMTGNADAGFIALSQLAANDVLPPGREWIVPPNLYDPIRQDAIITTTGKAIKRSMTCLSL